MKPIYIILLLTAILMPGCGKDKVKPSADYLLSLEAAKKIDAITSEYVSKSKSTLKAMIEPPLSDSIINALSFKKAELSFNQRLVRITADSVNVSVSWQGSWKLSDSREFNNRGVADLIFQRESMRLSEITGDNPFILPYERDPVDGKLSGMDSPPEPAMKSDNDVTAKSLPAKADEEQSITEKPLSQDSGDTTRTYAPQDATTPSLSYGKDKEHTDAAEPVNRSREEHVEVYTIQAGSFRGIERARVQFDFITNLLQKKAYDNLRIEKIGDFYTVRLGKYDKYSSAKNQLRELMHKIDSLHILKAYIKEDRIIMQQSSLSQ